MKSVFKITGMLILALASSACMMDLSQDINTMDAELAQSAEDQKFLEFCLSHYDTDGDGRLTTEECLAVRSMDCSHLEIMSLYGIHVFKNLDSLDCSGNRIEYLPLNDLMHLKYLNCSGNQIVELNVTTTEVSSLYCCPMQDSAGNTTLKYLYIRRGQEIEYVTKDRDKADPKRVPDETQIIAIPEVKDDSF